jgi:O-acetylserine/cysteine efflux transporter
MVMQLLLMTLIISSCFAFLQAGLAHAPPLSFGGWRALLAGVFLLLGLAITRRKLWPSRRLLKWLPPLSLVATTLTFGAMFESSRYTSTGIGTLLANLQPLVLGVLGFVIFHEPLTKKRGFILALSCLGVLLISVSQWNATQGSWLGMGLALITSFSTTLGSLIVKQAAPDTEDVLALTAWQLILGSLPLFALALYFEAPLRVHWGFDFIAILLYLVIFATALTTSIWFRLLQLHPASELAPYLLLTPIFGLGIAFFILQETLTISEVIGVAFILLGLSLDFLKKDS